MENGDKIKVHERIAALETSFKSLCESLERRFSALADNMDRFRDNDLHHVNLKLNWLLTTFVAALITLVFILIRG